MRATVLFGRQKKSQLILVTASHWSLRFGSGPLGHFVATSDTLMVRSLIFISLNFPNPTRSVSMLCPSQIDAMLGKTQRKEAFFMSLYIQSKFSLQGFRWPFCGGL